MAIKKIKKLIYLQTSHLIFLKFTLRWRLSMLLNQSPPYNKRSIDPLKTQNPLPMMLKWIKTLSAQRLIDNPQMRMT